MTSIHDLIAIDAWRRARKLDPAVLRRFRNAFYKRHVSPRLAIAELPTDIQADFARDVRLHELELDSRHDSANDGATKLVFRTADGLLIESVILRMTTGRTALCVSTQVGCAAQCDFCATGKMGLLRNLTVAEILDQIVLANSLLAEEGRTPRNIVFMGMGEPFHNETELYRSLDVLANPACFNLNLNRVLVSTIGIPAALVRCARAYPQARPAVSLHSANQEIRQRLMPIAARHTLDELRTAMLEAISITGHEIMIEYLLLEGINDSDADARALVDYLAGISVHVNLIPYNRIADAPHLTSSSPERRAEFSALLKSAGLNVTTRYSQGADIAAACGQLVREENRRRSQRVLGG